VENCFVKVTKRSILHPSLRQAIRGLRLKVEEGLLGESLEKVGAFRVQQPPMSTEVMGMMIALTRRAPDALVLEGIGLMSYCNSLYMRGETAG
jgi:hypothetical protein